MSREDTDDILPRPFEVFPLTIAVFCDGCGTEVQKPYLVHDLMTREQRLGVARDHMSRDKGWSCTADGDFCPACKPAQSDAAAHELCAGVFRDDMAPIEVTVSTEPPIVEGPYTAAPLRCLHGVDFWVEPTGEQLARWQAEEAR